MPVLRLATVRLPPALKFKPRSRTSPACVRTLAKVIAPRLAVKVALAMPAVLSVRLPMLLKLMVLAAVMLMFTPAPTAASAPVDSVSVVPGSLLTSRVPFIGDRK